MADSKISAFSDGTTPASTDKFVAARAGGTTVALTWAELQAAVTSVTGNAGTATALQTARNIDGQPFNGTAAITVIAPGTHAATGKTVPVAADEIPLVDSAASNVLKKLAWSDLRAAIRTDAVLGWTTVTKALDESVSSSTVLQADDELFFTATSGKQYEVELFVVYGSPAGGGTPDFKYAVGEDATTRGVFAAIGLGTSDAILNTQILAVNNATQAAGTATGDRVLKLTGWYTGNGGTFQLLWAQFTSGANATTVRAGSVLRYRLII